MALTYERAKETAERIKAVVNLAKVLKSELDEVLTFNSNLSIDWANATKPAFINEDAAGNLDGLKFSRQQLANAIGTLATLQAAYGSGNMGNLNLVADADADA